MEDAVVESFRQKLSKFDYIRFCACNFHGMSKGKVVPARNAANFIKRGAQAWNATLAMGPVSECPMSLGRCAKENNGNADFVPVLDTLQPVPWASKGKYKVGSVICETHWLDGTPQDACPRYVARKQLDELRELGLSLLSGFEHEFMVFEKGSRTPMGTTHEFLTTSEIAKHEDYLFEIDQNLSQLGINIETIQTEYSIGQFELVCQPKFGIKTCDETFTLREAIKEITHQHGWDYNFMSKPKPDVGNGTHLNFSLWDLKGEKNAFYNPEDPDGLSDTCRYFIGGLTKHIGAVTALSCPTVNCYRRLHTPWAPDVANWGLNDRMATFRVKSYSPKATLIESRIPGGATNPYLATAVTLAAGIDGIKNKLTAPPKGQTDAAKLPSTLAEALDALEADKVMVEALGPEFVEWFVQVKREFEVNAFDGFDPKDFTEERLEKEWNEYSKI